MLNSREHGIPEPGRRFVGGEVRLHANETMHEGEEGGGGGGVRSV